MNISKRLGYKLKRIQKIKPLKKVPKTNEIFRNVDAINRQADDNPKTRRISIGTKAKVNAGKFSRGGKTREKIHRSITIQVNRGY